MARKRVVEISGSDARRIMAGEQQAVWEEKTGRRQPEDLSLHLPAMIGKATEVVNRTYYRHKTGRQVYDPQPTSPGMFKGFKVLERDALGVKIQSAHFPWMVGHLDGVVQDGAWGVFESKHTGAVSDWNPPEAVVERNYWQGVHYVLLTAFAWVDFSCLYGLAEWQTFRIAPSDDDQTLLLGTLNRFARAVESDTPPELAIKAAAPKLDPKRAYTEAELRTWPIANEFADHAATLVETWAHAEKHELALERIKKLVLPEDTKSIEAFGVTIGVAKNGAKRVRLTSAKAPADAAA